ncbi:MAG: efflux RND transporter permease subunit [Saprospiraceae bacterium]|nr:efflux RND transporter permease subunit [Saprospiraceae bacterium]
MSGALPGEALTRETMMEIIPDYQKMALYGISRQNLDMVLEQLFGTYHRLYYSMRWDLLSKSSIKNVEKNIATFSNSHGIPVHFSGQYFEDQKQLKQLVFIFILVILLMYFILAIQYESLVQPLLVMLTIPLGITGAMAVLWWTGGSLDTMAAIGFIVILGLIVDDPILKIETLNRLNKKYLSEGQILNDELMKKMIHEAGSICLKPLLMVSLTTSPGAGAGCIHSLAGQ